MATRTTVIDYCDGCHKKDGSETPSTTKLIIGPDEYDLCQMHGDRFRAMLADALAPAPTSTALSA